MSNRKLSVSGGMERSTIRHLSVLIFFWQGIVYIKNKHSNFLSSATVNTSFYCKINPDLNLFAQLKVSQSQLYNIHQLAVCSEGDPNLRLLFTNQDEVFVIRQRF